MTENTSRWIWIPHWKGDDEHPGFQHYKDRDPVWIKNYRYLLRDDHYLDLNLAQRGLLHGLWLATAATGNGRISYTLRAVKRHLGLDERFRLAHLDPLIHAGFLDVRASEGLAERYQAASPEVEKEKEKKRSARERSPNGAAPPAEENHNRLVKPLPPEIAAEWAKATKDMNL